MGTNGKTVDIAGHPVPRLCRGYRNMIAGRASPYIAWGKSGNTMGDPPPLEEPQNYHVSFPQTARLLACPVEGCQIWVVIRTGLMVHFLHHHMQETVVVVDEGNPPPPMLPLL